MAAGSTYDYMFKFILIGDSGCGKSCILTRYTEDVFHKAFIQTIGIDFKIKTVQCDGHKAKLQIWDTAGDERFRTITQAYYRGATAVILVCDVTSSSSFENLPYWLENIAEHASSGCTTLLMANKCDLEEERTVSEQMLQSFAIANDLNLVYVSAKSGENIDTAFLDLVKALLVKQDVQPSP